MKSLLDLSGRPSTIDLSKMARRNARTYRKLPTLQVIQGRRLRRSSVSDLTLEQLQEEEIKKAAQFVAAQHDKYTADYSPGFPYFAHACLVKDNALHLLEDLENLQLLFPEEKAAVLKAALAHDVVEDTPPKVSTRLLTRELGPVAAMLVHRVTKANKAQRALLDKMLIQKLWSLPDQELERRETNVRTHPRVANLCGDLLHRKQNALADIAKASEKQATPPVQEFVWLRVGPLPSYELQELRNAHPNLWRAIYLDPIAHYNISERRRIAASYSTNNAFGRTIHDTEHDLIRRFGRRGASFFLGVQAGLVKLADIRANRYPAFPLTDDPHGSRLNQMDLLMGDFLEYALSAAQKDLESITHHQRAHLTMTSPIPSVVKAVRTDGKVSWNIEPTLSPEVLNFLKENWSKYAERFLKKTLERTEKYLLDTAYLAQQWKSYDSAFIASELCNDPSRRRPVSSHDIDFHTKRFALLRSEAERLHRDFQKKEAWLSELSSRGGLANALRLDNLQNRITGLRDGVSLEATTHQGDAEGAAPFAPAHEPLGRAV